MNLVKKASLKKVVIEPGEELLHNRYNFHVVEGKEISVFSGNDGGSTQSRVSLLEINAALSDEAFEEALSEALNTTYVIPSVFSRVTGERHVDAKGPELYHNMESLIINTDTRTDALINTPHQLVRGTRFFDIEKGESRLKSSTQKTADPTFYLNHLDALGYALCMKYQDAIPSRVKVKLGVSLPPDDIHPVNTAKFKKEMKSYKWSLKPFDVTIEFVIEQVYFCTEPEAFIKAYYAMAEQEVPEKTLHIEGGGRSSGVEIMINGDSLNSAQKSMDYGGTQLLDELDILYRARYGGPPLRRNVLEDAVRTGLMKIGNNIQDISDILFEAERVIANRLVDDTVTKAFDMQSRVAMKDLNTISVSGRLFNKTYVPFDKNAKYEQEHRIVTRPVSEEEGAALGEFIELSIAHFVAARFKELAPYTEFVHIEGNYIPQGLLFNALIKDGEGAEEEVQAEVVAAEAEVAVAAAETAVAESAAEPVKEPVSSELHLDMGVGDFTQN